MILKILSKATLGNALARLQIMSHLSLVHFPFAQQEFEKHF